MTEEMATCRKNLEKAYADLLRKVEDMMEQESKGAE